MAFDYRGASGGAVFAWTRFRRAIVSRETRASMRGGHVQLERPNDPNDPNESFGSFGSFGRSSCTWPSRSGLALEPMPAHDLQQARMIGETQRASGPPDMPVMAL